INVTSFFRDPPSWDYLQREILPRVLADKPAEEPARVWCAGCASGEEPYSLAITFAEALGLEGLSARVKIFGTDVDEEALNHARHAAYAANKLEDVPAELRSKYFEANGNRCTLHQEIRRAVIFGRHDLIQDAPISRLDLL